MHSSTGGSLSVAVSVQGQSLSGGLCPGGLCPGAVCLGGLCPEGSLSGRSPGQRPPEGTWDQRQRPLEGTWDQATRQEVTSYRDPLPPVNRMTHE